MTHPMTRLLLVTTILGGLTTVAAAQGYDPIGDRRFPNLALAGSAGFYLGQLQGPMSGPILSGEMDSAQVALQMGPMEYRTAPVGLYSSGSAPPPRRRISAPNDAPAPGSVSPIQY
jgi:hypothetical protein